jgi:hypothetical protein
MFSLPLGYEMQFTSLLSSIAVLVFTAKVQGLVSGTGQTFIVNGVNYYAAPDPVTIISATADMLSSASTSDVDLIPLTVMADSSSSFTTSVFRSIVGNYTAADDVFNIGFLQGQFLLTRSENY